MGEEGCPLHHCRITLHLLVATTISHQTWMQCSLAVCGPSPVYAAPAFLNADNQRSKIVEYLTNHIIALSLFSLGLDFPHAHSSIAKSKALAPKSHHHELGNEFNSHLH